MKLTDAAYRDKIAWLRRGRDIEVEIPILHRLLLKAREDATMVTVQPFEADARRRMGVYNHNEAYARVAEFSILVDRKIAELYTVKNEIMEAVAKVPNPYLRQLLELRYISGETWDRMPFFIPYSFDYIKKELHFAALDAIEVPPEAKSGMIHEGD